MNTLNQASPVGRRSFLKATGASSLALAIPRLAQGKPDALKSTVKIGLIADLHQDVMHDGESRMEKFVSAMSELRPDAILQVGDFAYPNKKNAKIISLFNDASPMPLHVIGNHDTDAGHTKKQCIDTWGMPGRYYVKNVGGVWLVVLDGNDKGSPKYKGGYPSYVGKEQVDWLKQQLAELDGPIVVVSHQPLAGVWAVDNAEEIQAILGDAAGKVILAINGHSHIDDAIRIKGVSYLHINSASYQWVGGKYQHESYEPAIHASYPDIKYTCPYRDCLYAVLSVDSMDLSVRVEGQESAWVGDSPAKLGKDMHPSLINGEEVAPRIRNRTILRIS